MDPSARDARDGVSIQPSGDGYAPRWLAGQQLLEDAPFEISRRFTARERWAEGGLAALFVIAAVAMAVTLPAERTPAAGLALALTVGYALASKVSFNVGAGVAVPTQLMLVPMLFILPAPAVPLFVAAGLALSAVPDVLTRRGGPERLLSAVADAWHAIGPALVLSVGAPATPSLTDWPLLGAALAAQVGADLVASAAREALGRGIAPKHQVGVLAWVHLVDVLLAPVGLAAAWAALFVPYGAFLGLPLAGLLAILARERNNRIRHALDLGRANRDTAMALAERVEELDRERARVELAIKRIGTVLSSSLDRAGLLEVVMETAIDALNAECGRILTSAEGDEPAFEEQVRAGIPDGLEPAMAQVAAKVLRERSTAELRLADAHAIACLLEPSHGGLSVLALARRERPFVTRERDLLEHLAGQAAASIDNIALHELVLRQAATDELTGLSNHRRLHEFLAAQIERSARSGLPVALVIVDIDHFKDVNDSHGHQAGDLVLKSVARLIASHCRAGDEPARYGGEELVLALPDTTLAGAYELGERLRKAIEMLETPFDGHRLKVTASLGVAAVSGGANGAADLIAAADAALYEAKRSGRNRTVRAEQRARYRTAGRRAA